MILNLLKELLIAYSIFNRPDCDLDDIIEDVETIPRKPSIKQVKRIIYGEPNSTYNPIPNKFKIAILDFEGKHPFLMGLMIRDILLLHYIENDDHEEDFYLFVLDVMKRLQDLVIFAFSTHEQEQLAWMHQLLDLRRYDVTEYDFIKDKCIVNLQKNIFESLAQAIYSMNPKGKAQRTTGDSLFRNISLINKLLKAGKFEEIIAHNQNCLLNESIIFLNRWLKMHGI